MIGDTVNKMSTCTRALYWVALGLNITGVICTIVGGGLPKWSVNDYYHFGIFVRCVDNFEACDTILDDTEAFEQTPYRSVKLYPLLWGLMIGGLFALVVNLVLLFVYMALKTVTRCKTVLGIMSVISLFLGVISVAASLYVFVDFFVIQFRISVDPELDVSFIFEEYIGYAWYLTVVGLGILVSSAIIFIIHMVRVVYYD